MLAGSTFVLSSRLVSPLWLLAEGFREAKHLLRRRTLPEGTVPAGHVLLRRTRFCAAEAFSEAKTLNCEAVPTSEARFRKLAA